LPPSSSSSTATDRIADRPYRRPYVIALPIVLGSRSASDSDSLLVIASPDSCSRVVTTTMTGAPSVVGSNVCEIARPFAASGPVTASRMVDSDAYV
jgi:hypothetical protein